jgi:diguanylate cyclase (GGDEF)-like protein
VIRHSSRQLESLIAIAASVAGAHRLEDVLEVAATRARAALDVATMSISRWEVERGLLRTLINAGEEQPWPEDEVYPLADFPAAVALLGSGRPHLAVVDDPDTDAAERRLLLKLEKESSAAVPIVFEGTTWGELYATTAPGEPRLTHADVHYMQAICGQIGLALGRAELFSRLSTLAFEDALTGLANRRAVEDRLAELAVRDEPAALLLGDLDGLKAVNDSAGHDAGDAVLRCTADVLRAAATGAVLDAFPGRLGGDEFCMLVPGATLEAAEALAWHAAARLRAAAVGVTFSWGVALTSGPGWKPAELLRAADVAQYQAKRSGGDRVHAAAAPVAGMAGIRHRAPRPRDRAHAAESLQDTTLAWLDGPGRGCSPARRVQGVAEFAADTLDAASWSVSEVSADGETVSTVAHTDRRLGPGVRVVHQRAAFRLADYPRTRAVLVGGGAFHVAAADPAGDAAEAALLRAADRTQVLAAGASGQLVELFGDAATQPMDWAGTVLRLLVREATAAAPSAG